MRLSELAEIRLSDLDPGLKQVRVMGKGAKMRVVPIGGEARKALKHYLKALASPEPGWERRGVGMPGEYYSKYVKVWHSNLVGLLEMLAISIPLPLPVYHI